MRESFSFAVLVVLVAVPGCTTTPEPLPPEPPPFVPPTMGDYPVGGAIECPPPGAQLTDFAFRLEGVDDAQPALAENSLRVLLNASAPRRPVVEWTWQHVAPRERPDVLGRALPAEVWRDEVAGWWLCARADLSAPDETTPPASKAMTLRARLEPVGDLLAGEYNVVLSWRVGCASCGGTPSGNATLTFAVGG